jgi:hypothetical protein
MSEQTNTQKPMTFAELAAMKAADLATFCKKIVRVDSAIEKAKEALTKNLKFFAKVVAALKCDHARKRDAREIPGDWDFKKYFNSVAGGDLPGRVEAMAALFNSLCQTFDAQGKPLLPEANFDAAANDWLEKANVVVKEAQRRYTDGKWKTSDDVLDIVNALSKPGDAKDAINSVRERQKGSKAEGEKEKGNATAMQPLTVGRCIEFLKAAIANGQNVLAAGKEQEAYDLFCATYTLHENWASSGISKKTLLGWTKKYTAAVAAVEKQHAPSPANAPAPVPAGAAN